MMEDFTQDVEQCLQILSKGGVVLYPTDTVWGLGCDATNEKAVEKLIQLKGKKPNQGLIVLLATERDVLQYVTQLDMSVFDYLHTTNRPTTVIYEGGTGVAEAVLANNGTIAIRLVQEDFCRHLIKRFRKPIVSTSANFHTAPTPTYFHEIDDELKKSVDYIVQYRQNDTHAVPPSSIIKWFSNGSVEIIR